MNTTLQILLDQKMKSEASKIFKSIGITLSSGLKLYLAYVVNTARIPFDISATDNISESKKKKVK
ncbi:hypothetical protein AUJ77_01180 [Candidatus Nomurabacteria bacterium CG1_02_43_90]|uniref:Uncharacterized protein n=1 Tax=Candidatus Nomurabacteria bacterium CG1_02_43_90 TaxID=1805281 RepID=A0A1J4V9I5_9BACT|nr:MAG: hypothetical protein AUJ77_01180 [Candidatus Nomurabacteria bacterium CG1_02_43_90]